MFINLLEMKVLYICHHNPFGSIGGGCLASHAYLKAFCDICDGNLDLICSSSLKEEISDGIHCSNIYYVNPRTLVDKMLSVVTGIMTRYINFTKKFIEEGRSYDFVVFDHSCIAGHLVDFFNNRNIKTITIHHNYEPEYFKANADLMTRIFYSHHVKKSERLAYLGSCANLFFTDSDMKMFKTAYGSSGAKDYLSGGFLYKDNLHRSAHLCRHNPITFVITGSFDCRQSYDGISYFFNELYDLLPKDCRVIIAGKSDSNYLRKITEGYSNVILYENPVDVNSVIQEADIYICPIRDGGGLKFRIMDGLNNGLPIVCHTKAARGYEVLFNSSLFRIFKSRNDFSNNIDYLLNKREDGNNTDLANAFHDYFSYEEGLKRLSIIIDIMSK